MGDHATVLRCEFVKRSDNRRIRWLGYPVSRAGGRKDNKADERDEPRSRIPPQPPLTRQCEHLHARVMRVAKAQIVAKAPMARLT